MLSTVAVQGATAGKASIVGELETTHPPHGGENHRDVEIDQVGVVDAVALGVADTVRVMADIAGGSFFDNMFVVQAETLIAQDTVAVVAAVTQGVVGGALRRVVEGQVLPHQDGFESRAVRALRAGTAA